MVSEPFNNTISAYNVYAGQQGLQELDRNLRKEIIGDLDEARRKDSAPLSDEQKIYRADLEILYKALTEREGAFLTFSHEPCLPAIAHYRSRTFDESLLRIHAGPEQKTVNPICILDALAKSELVKDDLYEKFCMWMFPAQINSFYNQPDRQPWHRVSINLLPKNLDSESCRKQLKDTMNLAIDANCLGIIIELTEYGPWCDASDDKDRIDILMDDVLVNDRGEMLPVFIAVDDIGAKNGNNDPQCLKKIQEKVPYGRLILKLDGPIIEEFLNQQDDAMAKQSTFVQCLKTIRSDCRPDAIVVCEWSDGERVKAAQDKLTSLELPQLAKMLHMSQDRSHVGKPRGHVLQITDPQAPKSPSSWAPSPAA